MRTKRQDALPHSLAPIGLSREVAAAFIDVSPSKFDQMVADGRMPKPKRIDGRRVWDRTKIERAFSNLPGDEDFEEDELVFEIGTPRVYSTQHKPFLPDGDVPEEYRKPMGANPTKLERRLLRALYDAGPNLVSINGMKGISIGTIRRLAVRGYIEDEDDVEYHEARISAEGIAAYEALQ